MAGRNDRPCDDAPDLRGLKGRDYAVALMAAKYGIHFNMPKTREPELSVFERNMVYGKGF